MRARAMAELYLPDFPDTLIERIDRYIGVLEELNPGYRWSRSACVATLLSRALSEMEGAEVRWSRRNGRDRRAKPRASAPDRRQLAYPDFVDLVIEQLLNRPPKPDDDTWRTSHEG